MKRVVDLFAGGGGMSLGFQQSGFHIICAIEKWRPAIQIYRANFKNHPVIDVDLSNESVAIDTINQFQPEIIIGGPPCQDFSSAGKRDEMQGRANLTINFSNIIAACQPEYFVMENVSRATRSDAFKKAIMSFKYAGYGLTIKILDAAYCGTPQFRKRLFVIGVRGGKDESLNDYLELGLARKPMTLRDYFGDQLGLTHYYRHPRSYARRGIFSIDEPSPTIRGVNRPIPKGYPGHLGDPKVLDENIRSLTTFERAQIQTFPINFILPGCKTDIEQIIGNAVPVKLAEYVARCLARYIQDGGIGFPRQSSIFNKSSHYCSETHFYVENDVPTCQNR
jgi:DNA (cytosine-5)-methyltransferase 1